MLDSDNFICLVVISFVNFSIATLSKSSIQVYREALINRIHICLHFNIMINYCKRRNHIHHSISFRTLLSRNFKSNISDCFSSSDWKYGDIFIKSFNFYVIQHLKSIIYINAWENSIPNPNSPNVQTHHHSNHYKFQNKHQLKFGDNLKNPLMTWSSLWTLHQL